MSTERLVQLCVLADRPEDLDIEGVEYKNFLRAAKAMSFDDVISEEDWGEGYQGVIGFCIHGRQIDPGEMFDIDKLNPRISAAIEVMDKIVPAGSCRVSICGRIF